MGVTVNLSPSEVENIIKNYLKDNFGTVGKIKFKISNQSVGYWVQEREEFIFQGVEAEVGLK